MNSSVEECTDPFFDLFQHEQQLEPSSKNAAHSEQPLGEGKSVDYVAHTNEPSSNDDFHWPDMFDCDVDAHRLDGERNDFHVSSLTSIEVGSDFQWNHGWPDRVETSSNEVVSHSMTHFTMRKQSSMMEGLEYKPLKRPSLGTAQRNKCWIISHIEAVFETVTDILSSAKDSMFIPLRSRYQARDQSTSPPSYYEITFPGASPQEAWHFAVVVRILGLVHECLIEDITRSKRDLFYRDPALFGNQAVVDRFVDDLACTWGVSRSLLNVTATARGLIAGAFIFHREDGSVADGLACREGILVEDLKPSESVDLTRVQWILVVEKEASFRSLAASAFWDDICKGGVIITGKGYPDLKTRRLLKTLSTPTAKNGFCEPQTFALVDFDPDGLLILSTYKFGSKKLAHEPAVTVPKLIWLGVRSDHAINSRSVYAEHGLLPLTTRDRRKASSMLRSDCLDEEWRRELQLMLTLNVKAEIQLSESEQGGLVTLLRRELHLAI